MNASNSTTIDTISDMFTWLSSFIETYSSTIDMFALYESDSTLTSYLNIKQLSGDLLGGIYGAKSELEELDKYIT